MGGVTVLCSVPEQGGAPAGRHPSRNAVIGGRGKEEEEEAPPPPPALRSRPITAPWPPSSSPAGPGVTWSR